MKKFLAQAYIWILLIILYAPIVIIAIFSFTEAKVMGNWTGFSTELYRSLFTGGINNSLIRAIINTLSIAVISAIVSTVLGTIAAIGIHNLKGRRRQAINFVNDIPMMNPDIITGISLFILFVSIGLTQGYLTVVLAHISFCTPYVVLSVMPRLTQMNPNIYEAALDLGATPMQALRKVIIPDIKPGMISGLILAFTLSIDDFAVTLFTKGNQGLETLSTYIYADARKGGLTPELRPLMTIIIFTVLILLIVINIRSSRNAKRIREKDKRKFAYRISSIAVAFLLLTSCVSDRSTVLKVYNWADYIDEDLLEEFEEWYEEETGEEVTVIYQLFDINEVMLSKIERGHEDFDVVCPSDYIIERMLRADMLIPVDHDFGKTPNYIDQYISPFIKDMFDKVDGYGKNANDYAVGYMWGTTGFMYNTRFVEKEEVSTWNALANPRFKGKIFVKDAFRDVYSPLLIYLKQDELKAGTVTMEDLMLDSSDESIALVENYLKSVKDHVAGWEADFGKEAMTQEKAWINLTWSGDASWAIEEAAEVGVPLDYVIPSEGSNVWFDGWVIPKYARNVKAARYFINFMCKPENAIRNMDAIGYVSTVAAPEVMEYMADEESFEPLDASYFFGEEASQACLNPVYYADRSDIERCSMMHDSGPRTEQMLAMWSRVKGDNATGFTYVLICVAIIGFAAYGIFRRVKKRNKVKKYGRQLSRKKVRGI